jgi:hypothetical protein
MARPQLIALGAVCGVFIASALLTFLGILGVSVLTPDPVKKNEDIEFVYSFNVSGTLYEAPSAEQSASEYWFLDSGGKLVIHDGIGETAQGPLATVDRWWITYAHANPLDTDGGFYPQNIFRLLTQQQWDDSLQEMKFRIARDNLSLSPNRNESNGVLFISRYQDADNLYYAGVRVDGTAVIKKKFNGKYYTMAQNVLYPGRYDSRTNPNLIPQGTWIGLRNETRTQGGSVIVLLQIDDSSGWRTIATATDTGMYGRTPPIVNSGRNGIRTDFMDVQFDDYRVRLQSAP